MIENFDQIKGFLHRDEGIALYKHCKSVSQKGICVEIGSYCGKSACYLGLACQENDSILYSVDHHQGSEEQQFGEEYFDEEIYDHTNKRVNTLPLFQENIKKFNLEKHVKPIVMKSIEASKVISDKLDLIFIDGSHTFKSANTDYDAWKNKLRKGGCLAIHDIYDSPEEGGQAPKEIYERAISDGFRLVERVNSLVLLY